jgi:hypothetical protein
MFSKIWWTIDISLYNGCVAYVSKLFKSVYVLTCANFADLHWGGFTTQRGDKKRTNLQWSWWKMSMHLYCMCQILVLNAINTIVTDMECNIRIDWLPLGRGTDLGQSVYPDIAFHISNYKINIRQRTPEIPFKIRRIDIFHQDHWRFP